VWRRFALGGMCPPDTLGSRHRAGCFDRALGVADPHRRRDQRSPARLRERPRSAPRRRGSRLLSRRPGRRNTIGLPASFAAAWIAVVRPPPHRGRPRRVPRPPDGLREPPLFRPRLRCAFASVASSVTSAGGRPAVASARNRRCRTPSATQRATRLHSVFGGLHSRGAYRQGRPDCSTCTIPLITCRSSTRGLPRLSAGKSGTKRRICASLGETRIDHPGSAPSSQGNHFDSHRPASLKERYEGGA
jgi:hypothetical protein